MKCGRVQPLPRWSIDWQQAGPERHIVAGRTLGLCLRIRRSVFIRSLSATPVVACALNPQNESSSSSLTSTNASILNSPQLYTLLSLDDLAKRLIALVEPVEAIAERIDYLVKVGETVMSPLSVTEHAFRGAMDRLRNRAAQ